MHEARGIKQDVDLADAFGHRGYRGAVAGVERRDIRYPFALEGAETFLVNVGREYDGALARKRKRTGAANSGSGGGHESALALEPV